MKRKAQVKMGENIAILFIFLILIVFGLVFYMKVQKTTYTQKVDESFSEDVIKISQIISMLPETRCPTDIIGIENCIDLIKLNITSNLINQDTSTRLHYFDKFKYSKIQLTSVYPLYGVNITFYNYPNKENQEELQYHYVPIPVLSYDAITSNYIFSILEVFVYK